MQVFKAYFKILKQIYPVILVYIVIFFGISLLATTNGSSSTALDFEAIKPKIVLINNDEETPLLTSFRKYLESNTTLVEMEDEEEKLSDALFFRKIHYIIKVPSNFTESFMEGNLKKLDTLKLPDSTTTIFIESLIDKFFNTANLYSKSSIDENILSENIIKNLETSVNVQLVQKEKMDNNLNKANYFFNFTNYTFLALLILVIGLVTQSFNQIDLKRRNLCSPIKLSKMNFELMLGNISVTITIWMIFVLASIVLYGATMFTTNGLLLILNSFVFILTALSIGFLIGNLVENTEAQSAIANVLSLGTSFICGAFVPQMFLGSTVLMIAKIFPSYYFIRANDIISATPTLDSKNLNIIFTCILIQVVFMIGIYIASYIVTRLRRQRA
jgi:ABC-2 type transport system permease protein